MDFTESIDRKIQEITDMEKRLENMKKSLNDAAKFTAQFLAICQKRGITKVAIGVSHESVPESTKWPFSCSGSVFTTHATSKDGWPAIWGAVDEAGINNGCGNSNQHQANLTRLIDGCYHLKDGKWYPADKKK